MYFVIAQEMNTMSFLATREGKQAVVKTNVNIMQRKLVEEKRFDVNIVASNFSF